LRWSPQLTVGGQLNLALLLPPLLLLLLWRGRWVQREVLPQAGLEGPTHLQLNRHFLPLLNWVVVGRQQLQLPGWPQK
jgi:hypothetical protein